MVYLSDPHAAPDADFEPAGLHHLVCGARLRLLDDRRTPLGVVGVDVPRGLALLEVAAFEDAGARWEMPLEDVSRRLQAPRGAARAPEERVGEYRAAAARLDRPLRIEAPADACVRTLERVAAARAAVRRELPRQPRHAEAIARRTGEPELIALADRLIERRGLGGLDRSFTAALVSNPGAEAVKAHAIVLAELGLCAYDGKVVRDPSVFAGEGAPERRGEHLVLRMALAQELWSQAGREDVTLFRGATADGRLPPPPRASLVSATFSRAVAEDHFAGGPATRVAVLVRQEVPLARLVLTFLETRAMNERFREAEATLIGEPANRAF